MLRRWFIGLTAALALGMLCLPHLQAKPNPEAIVEQDPSQPDIAGFAKAYKLAGEPTLLVLVRTMDPQLPASTYTAMLDPAADANLLKVSMEEQLLKNRNLELVNPEALQEVIARSKDVLKQQNERAAIDLLAAETKAKLVLDLRLVANNALAGQGVRYRMTVQTLDMSRGRTLTSFGFDWKQGSDAGTIKKYAGTIIRKFVEQYIDAIGDGKTSAVRPYTVKLIGIDSIKDLNALRKTLQETSGVESVKTDGQLTKTNKQSVAQLTVKFAGGSLDLAEVLQTAAKKATGAETDVTDAESGTITLKFGRRATTDWTIAERIWGLTDKDNQEPDSKQMKEMFLGVYQQQGSPRIGIIINRSMSDEEKKAANIPAPPGNSGAGVSGTPSGGAGASGGNTNIVVAPTVTVTGSGSRDTLGEAVVNLLAERERRAWDDKQVKEGKLNILQTKQMENAVYEQFGYLGLNLVDPDQMRTRLMNRAAKDKEIYQEGDLTKLILEAAKDGGMDVVISGIGQIHVHPSGLRVASYTFRAYNVSDGRVLASMFWAEDAGVDLKGMDPTVTTVGRYTAGSLAEQMWRAWGAPRRVTVMLQGANSPKDVFAVIEALQKNVPGISKADYQRFEATPTGGVGYFTLSLTGDYDTLVKKIAQQDAALPFALDSKESTRETLVLRIKPATTVPTAKP